MRLSTSILVSLTLRLISGAAGFSPTNIKSRTRSSISTIHTSNNNEYDNKLVRHTNVATKRTRLTMAMKDAADLTSALAKIDSQQNTRSSKRPTGGKAGWTKLILENENDNDNDSSEEEESAYALPKEQEFVYLLEPPSTPSMIILFLGGAGLGQFPHIAYSSLLSRISTRLNAAVITAPYPLSLDHFELAKKAGEALRRATVQCEEMGNYSTDLPKFYLGHSLGSKLLGIALAASGVRDVDGIGFMSYNNFGFKNTISMVKTFADDFNKNGGFGGAAGAGAGAGGFGAGMPNNLNLDQILDFAGEAASMMGFEFKPDPETMDRIVEMKFDENLQKKTRMFIFDDDDLDSSQSFLDACYKGGSGSGPSVSKLEGTHLSPVYLNFGLDDLDLPEEAMPFVSEASGGFQNASFGDEDAMNGAVNEICNWIMGQEPSRPPLLTAGKAKAGDTN